MADIARRGWGRIALVTVPGIVIAGSLSGYLSNSGYGNDFFDSLVMPAFMPPGWTFGIVWPILYALLGISLAMILAEPPSATRTRGLVLFAVQLALNFAWSPIFFAAHAIQLAVLVIAVMAFFAAMAALIFWRMNRLAGALMLPYLAWLLFASALNAAVIHLNPGAGTLPLW